MLKPFVNILPSIKMPEKYIFTVLKLVSIGCIYWMLPCFQYNNLNCRAIGNLLIKSIIHHTESITETFKIYSFHLNELYQHINHKSFFYIGDSHKRRERNNFLPQWVYFSHIKKMKLLLTPNYLIAFSTLMF